MTCRTPRTFDSYMSRQSCGRPFSTVSAPIAPPALLTRTSHAPISATAVATLTGSVTSMTTARAAAAKLCGNLLQRLTAPAAHHDVMPFVRQPPSRGSSDAAASTCDDRDRAHPRILPRQSM